MEDFADIRTDALEALNDARMLVDSIKGMSLSPTRSPMDLGDDLSAFLDRARRITNKLESARDLAYSRQVTNA